MVRNGSKWKLTCSISLLMLSIICRVGFCEAENGYDWVSSIYNSYGLGYARIGEDWLVIDREGNALTDPIYDSIYIDRNHDLIIAYGMNLDIYLADENKIYSGYHGLEVVSFDVFGKTPCVQLQYDQYTEYYYISDKELIPIDGVKSMNHDYIDYINIKRENADGLKLGTTESLCEFSSYIGDHLDISKLTCYKTERYLFEALDSGKADAIIVYNSEYLNEHLDDFEVIVLALDALVFYNNLDSSVDDVDVEYIESIYSDIYLGKYMTDDTIAFLCSKQSDAYREFGKSLKFQSSATDFAQKNRLYNNGIEIEYLNFPTAFGYGLLHVYKSMNQQSFTKMLSVDGVKPNKESLINGEYAFIKPIILVTLKSHLLNTDFIYSSEFCEWINNHFFFYPHESS